MTTSLIIALLLCNMIKYFLAVACVLRSRGVGVIDLETNYTDSVLQQQEKQSTLHFPFQ